MALLALLVGILVIVVGAARMGWIADFLSVPVVTGFLAGIAVTIIAGQLPEVLGLPPTTGNAVQKLVGAVQNLDDTNLYALAVAVAVFAVIVAAERVSRRIPGALIGVLLSLAASATFDLSAKGVATLGGLPAGLPALQAPTLTAHLVWRLLPSAFAVALIVITQTSATTRSFAELGGFETDVDRDFIGVGAGSVLAAFMGGFAVNASPPRSAVVTSSGGRSQVPSLAAGAIVVVLIVAAAGLLADLPLATLGAVLIYVALRIFRVHDLHAIYGFDKVEFGVAIATLGTVAVLRRGPRHPAGHRALHPLPDLAQRPAARTRCSVGCRARPSGGRSRNAPTRSRCPVSWPTGSMRRCTSPTPRHFRDRVREVVAAASPPPSLFVLDASGIDDVDYTGGRMLLQVVHELHARGVDFAVARATGDAPLDTARAGLRRHVRDDHVFLTVDEAVRALGPEESCTRRESGGPGADEAQQPAAGSDGPRS